MYTPLKRQIVWALSIALLVAPASFAQTTADGGPDPATVRVRIGPLWMNPTISMPNIGIDTNVFNDPPNVTPKEGLYDSPCRPKAELWLRMGRTWLSGLVAEEIVWYQKYTTERSVNNTYTIGWKAPLNRLVLTTSATWSSTRSAARIRNRCARPAQRADVCRKRRGSAGSRRPTSESAGAGPR